MNRIKPLWKKYSGYILLGLPVAVIVLCVAVTAAKPQPRTIAEPPAETEITFDMDRNRAYTADDGIIVIGDMVTPAAAKTEAAPLVAATETASEAAPTVAATVAKIVTGKLKGPVYGKQKSLLFRQKSRPHVYF